MGRSRGLIFAAIAAWTVAGCGSESGPSDKDEITTALEKTFVRLDPEDCETYFTPGALEQRLLGSPADPLEDCREDAPEERPADTAIEVTDLVIDGNDATAKVETVNGGFDGALVEVALRQFDVWKVDRIGEMDIYDAEEFISSQNLDGGDEGFTSYESACTRSYIEENVPVEELEGIYVDQDLSPFYRSFVECVGDGSRAYLIETIMRRVMIDDGLSQAQVDCVAAKTGRAFNLRFEDFVDVNSVPRAILEAALGRAFVRCEVDESAS